MWHCRQTDRYTLFVGRGLPIVIACPYPLQPSHLSRLHCELLKAGTITTENIPSSDNLTDLFTKPLARDHHHRFIEALNIKWARTTFCSWGSIIWWPNLASHCVSPWSPIFPFISFFTYLVISPCYPPWLSTRTCAHIFSLPLLDPFYYFSYIYFLPSCYLLSVVDNTSTESKFSYTHSLLSMSLTCFILVVITTIENRTAAKTGEPEPDWTELSVLFCWFQFSASVLNWTSETLMLLLVSSERAFSQGGITISKCCNFLKGDIVKALQCIKCAIHCIQHDLLFREPAPSSILEAKEGDDEELQNSSTGRDSREPGVL